eukprot:CAMPEP_0113565862 /NCGR_PEP_ID=MMETSP0015_2-20120614/22409_1 /TAXON_ID=2838 /ORGANISM="Odontella" /LENGTH=167 /DNA_ID=CAMNT_0000468099 /DNA_START=25 /DNA_END=525 /DNA_ORIENTATION=- /assembly_acc=CAM_ASM_000160
MTPPAAAPFGSPDFGGGGGGHHHTAVFGGTGRPPAANHAQDQQQQQHQQHFALSSPPAQSLPSMHRDFVHCVAFDHFGRRIATCSGDRTVKVWDLNDSGEWTFSGSEWQAHKGSVNRVAWAHPEFGQLLATCGTDHAATVWEEREGGLGLPSLSSAQPAAGTASGGE